MTMAISQCNKKCTSLLRCSVTEVLDAAGPAGGDGHRMIYQAFQTQTDLMQPARLIAGWMRTGLANPALAFSETLTAQTIRAVYEMVERAGLRPRYRHLANSAASLTRPDTHFDLVRPGIAVYGLSPVAGEQFGLRPAMTARARVMLTKRVAAGTGVSYGHTYLTEQEANLAVVPLGYADGVPRHASNTGPVHLAGKRRTISGRVCMDQFVVDCGDDEVAAGDVVTLFGSGAEGEPTADDWAEAVGTINYEIVTRFGGVRVPRVYDGERA